MSSLLFVIICWNSYVARQYFDVTVAFGCLISAATFYGVITIFLMNPKCKFCSRERLKFIIFYLSLFYFFRCGRRWVKRILASGYCGPSTDMRHFNVIQLTNTVLISIRQLVKFKHFDELLLDLMNQYATFFV